MYFRGLFGVLVLFCVAACASSGRTPPGMRDGWTRGESGAARHFYVRRHAGDGPARAWAVLLPGSSGLRIFDDDAHYFRAAERLNAIGVDTLVVDSRPAYHAASGAPGGQTGDKIAWTAREGVAWARANGRIERGVPGVVVAWSLGGEGLWRLLVDDAWLREQEVAGGVAFYPTNEDGLRLRSRVPALVFVGGRDDVAPPRDIRDGVGGGASDERIEIVEFPGARHGFDIETLRTARTARLLPLVGPSATFAYDEAAAREAAARLEAFVAGVER